jgi:hypothetical protein
MRLIQKMGVKASFRNLQELFYKNSSGSFLISGEASDCVQTLD